MASGRNAQMTIKTEVAFGTAIAATEGLEFTKESISGRDERLESAGLRPGRTALRVDQWTPGRHGAEGDVEFEIRSEGFGVPFLHMLGDVDSLEVGSFTPALFANVFAPGSRDALSATVQVGRPTVAGVTVPFTYAGTKVMGWEIEVEENNYAILKLNLDAQREFAGDTGGATVLQTAVYPETGLPYTGFQCIVRIDGTPVPFRKATIKGGNAMDGDRWFLGSRYKTAQVEGGEIPGVDVTLTGDFTGLAEYARMASGAIVPIEIEFTGEQVDGVGSELGLLIEIPNARTDGKTSNVGGPAILEGEVNLKGLASDDDPHVRITYTSTVDYS